MRSHRVENALGVAVRGIDDDQVRPRIHDLLAAEKAILADRGRRRDPEPALVILEASGCCSAFSMSFTVISPMH